MSLTKTETKTDLDLVPPVVDVKLYRDADYVTGFHARGVVVVARGAEEEEDVVTSLEMDQEQLLQAWVDLGEHLLKRCRPGHRLARLHVLLASARTLDDTEHRFQQLKLPTAQTVLEIVKRQLGDEALANVEIELRKRIEAL